MRCCTNSCEFDHTQSNNSIIISIIYKAIKRVGNAESGSKQSKDAEPGSKQSKDQKKLNKPGRSQVVFYMSLIISSRAQSNHMKIFPDVE